MGFSRFILKMSNISCETVLAGFLSGRITPSVMNLGFRNLYISCLDKFESLFNEGDIKRFFQRFFSFKAVFENTRLSYLNFSWVLRTRLQYFQNCTIFNLENCLLQTNRERFRGDKPLIHLLSVSLYLEYFAMLEMNDLGGDWNY